MEMNYGVGLQHGICFLYYCYHGDRDQSNTGFGGQMWCNIENQCSYEGINEENLFYYCAMVELSDGSGYECYI